MSEFVEYERFYYAPQTDKRAPAIRKWMTPAVDVLLLGVIYGLALLMNKLLVFLLF